MSLGFLKQTSHSLNVNRHTHTQSFCLKNFSMSIPTLCRHCTRPRDHSKNSLRDSLQAGFKKGLYTVPPSHDYLKGIIMITERIWGFPRIFEQIQVGQYSSLYQATTPENQPITTDRSWSSPYPYRDEASNSHLTSFRGGYPETLEPFR